MMKTIALQALLCTAAAAMPPLNYQPERDWLVEPSGFKARVERGEKLIALDNGLVRREFRIDGEGYSTTAYLNPATGESILRAVRPDVTVTIDGFEHHIGGMLGQPNLAFLRPEDLATMTFDPTSMRLVGVEEVAIAPPFEWKRMRHHASGAEWPPPGVGLDLHFEPANTTPGAPDSRKVLWEDDFSSMDPGWKRFESRAAERISFENEGKAGEIMAPAGRHCFAERPVPKGTKAIEVGLHPGTDQSGGGWGPGVALGFGGQVVKVNLRPGDRGVHGNFELRVNGSETLRSIKALQDPDGGLSLSHGYRLRVDLDGERMLWSVAADQAAARWHPLFTHRRPGPDAGPDWLRVGKMGRLAKAEDNLQYPGAMGRCRVTAVRFLGAPDPAKRKRSPAAFRVTVHYELYDGIPLLGKRISVHNSGKAPITVERFTGESLALVEHSNHVGAGDGLDLPKPRSLHVETDMAFNGFKSDRANRHTVHYKTDPEFKTQVNYPLKQPCVLEVSPRQGVGQDVAPGEHFASFRIFELVMDSTERERRGLSQRRMYRTVAPWVTENPLMHHLAVAAPETVRTAIDQAAEVGFEMVILSFGSGFNAENDSPSYLKQWKELNNYARSKGIELGGYSLYSSRRIGGGNDIVTPEGTRPTHGNCPAITSEWGRQYLKKLHNLFETTGFSIFEHDGTYPGDVDVTPRPPLQKGERDSQWVHWRIWTDFYQWLRGRGVYLNLPDYYFLSGSNKCGMGYREVNWSLPRSHQLIHTRQNIHDGTWEKTPSMGWMFVPLTNYHGGGPAATVEPLDEHIDHYERMILSNLAFGVQACYRGPRLYDTPRVRDMLKGHVAWFKQYRDILESDLIHLRRPDGRRLDGMLHVNSGIDDRALLAVFNPTGTAITEDWRVPLYYAGLRDKAAVSVNGGTPRVLELDPLQRVRVPLTVPAGGFVWVLFRQSEGRIPTDRR